MPKHMVNLDALIPREDFEAASSEVLTQPSGLMANLGVTDLGPDSLMYNVLRKPDFQRETANWTPDKVAALVRSFLEGDLIPAIILWRSPKSGNIFAIDGAHRLSALTAWVHDDYGDKHRSLRFFDGVIPNEQQRAAETTRRLIQESVGSFTELKLALQNSDTTPKEKLRLARNLSAFALQLQWVNGEAEKAESSFFRINQQATPIDPTELDMIKARRKPNALAARAFIRAGTGHKYWSSFEDSVQLEIESLAKDVYDLIFKPTLDLSIRSADLPVAGRGYSADSVKMVFELVNFVNQLQPDMWRDDIPGRKRAGSKEEAKIPLADDTDGTTTIQFMRSVKRAAAKIAGNSPSSLGFHPAVYFYSATGRFQPAAFLAAVAFTQDLSLKRRLPQFTELREEFENFLVKYKHFLNQIVQAYGSLQRSVPSILEMYKILLDSLGDELGEEEIIARMQTHSSPRLPVKVITADDRRHGRNFSSETKNAIVLKATLDSSSRCEICQARLHLKSMTIDHKIRKEDGGTGEPGNGQLTHPYCNSGYKESRHANRDGLN
ncbi:HNH endonuclease family protein [Streptomyces platensis]|uniref:HNH endonuclease family protein n=1 Tax=Streptomyces platensis TaxID=58346 RepID=UPI00386343E3|nr:HNH endonuclease [Streptomyces platensis]